MLKTKSALLLITFLVLGGVFGGGCFHDDSQESINLSPAGQNSPSGPEEQLSPDDNLVKNKFTNKVVYRQEPEEEKLKQDCQARQGNFNTCGSACGPETEICAQVCVPVCELNSNQAPGGSQVDFSGVNDTKLPLKVSKGLRMEIWTENVSGARDLSGVDGMGNRWLSRTEEGSISLIEVDENGQVSNVSNVFEGLNQPHGLAIDPQDGLVLYYAETDKVSRVRLYTEGQPEKLVDLPAGGGHFTRSLKFGSDGELYVSIGSSCNVCQEDDPRRAAIYRIDKDGNNFEQVASGLRNAVFMENDPVTGEMWATEMGRDNLGDNLPPDEVNVIEEENDYGWPFCYGKNVADKDFQAPAGGSSVSCENKTGAKINLQAHSAPLGMAFVPEEGWPEEYRLDLLVAYHGSWNRSEPTGYKVMRFDLSDSPQREVLDRQALIEGWLTPEGEKLGRPVDLEVTPAGELFITDDQRGVIYRATTLPPKF